MATGIQVSKAVVYAILAPKTGVNVAKANVYAILAPKKGLNVAKAVIYAVLAPPVARDYMPTLMRLINLQQSTRLRRNLT